MQSCVYFEFVARLSCLDLPSFVDLWVIKKEEGIGFPKSSVAGLHLPGILSYGKL
jgi:hypothetical protein